jgi:hypothetical protein
LKTEERFLQDFPEFAGRIAHQLMQAGAQIKPPELPDGVGEEQGQLIDDVREVWEDLNRVMELGTIRATLLNFHPWPIMPSGPHHTSRVIPACNIGEPYALYVFDTPAIDLADRGAKWKVTGIWPIQLARDVIAQNDPRHGGLVCYRGTGLPGKLRDEEANADVKAATAEARKIQMEYYFALAQEAQKAMQNKDTVRNITTRHRLAAQYLHHWKLIKDLPEWITARTTLEDAPKTFCDGCGKEVSPLGFKCSACEYITNPAMAYEKGEIDEEHRSLPRLTRPQLDGLGLHHIQTLTERRNEARKAAKEARK